MNSLNEDDSFETLFDQIIGYSMCLLYTQQTKDQILKMEFVNNNEQDDFIEHLCNWGENESEGTFKELNNKGVDKKDIKLLLDKLLLLQDIVVISPSEDESILPILNTLFIGLNDLIQPIYEDLEKMHEEFPLKYDEFLVDKNNFKLINPFLILDKLLIKFHRIFDLIDANNDIPFDYLDFSPQFQFLPSMINEIETENIKENDFNILKKNCCLIILEGFVFNQVWIKLDEEQLFEAKKKWSFCQFQNDDQFQLCSEYENLIKYWNQLYKLKYKYNEKELTNIIKKYSKDKDILNYLKPLIECVIPFFEKMKDTKNILKLLFDISKKYQACLKELSAGNEQLYDKGIIVLLTYYPILPFQLIDSPDSSFDLILKEIINAMNSIFIKNSNQIIQIPQNMKEPTQNGTLIQQKYILVYRMLQCLLDCQKESFCHDDIFLIFALLTWRINDVSQEARDLENYLNNSIKLHLEHYDYDKNDLRFYAKFIIDKVYTSTNPLNKTDFDKNIAKLTSKSIKSIKPNSTCSACCNIQ